MGPSQKRAALAARLIKSGEIGQKGAALAACFSRFDRAVVMGWLMVLYDRDAGLRAAMENPEVKRIVPASFWVDVRKGKEKTQNERHDGKTTGLSSPCAAARSRIVYGSPQSR